MLSWHLNTGSLIIMEVSFWHQMKRGGGKASLEWGFMGTLIRHRSCKKPTPDWTNALVPPLLCSHCSIVNSWLHHFISWGISYVNPAFNKSKKQTKNQKRELRSVCAKEWKILLISLDSLDTNTSFFISCHWFSLFSVWKKYHLEVPVEVTQVFCTDIII